MIYFDSNAFIKLVRNEDASSDLVEWLADRPERIYVSSVLLDVEAARALNRDDPAALATLPSALARVHRVEIDQVIRATAGGFQDQHLRSLDAIHLATAQYLSINSGGGLTAFVSYDKKLLKVAKKLGLPTVSPGQ